MDSISDNRALIAGVGNVFLSDDAFGATVIRRLAARTLDYGVHVADFGIRSVPLAYEILKKKYQTVIIVDAMSRGGAPGDLYVVDPSQDDGQEYEPTDSSTMNSDDLVELLRKLSATPKRLLLVGCEPLKLEEDIGLSDPVNHAVEKAVEIILETLAQQNDGVSGSTKH